MYQNMNKMYEDILGEEIPICPDCHMEMEKIKDYYVCPNGCWIYKDGKYKVGIGS